MVKCEDWSWNSCGIAQEYEKKIKNSIKKFMFWYNSIVTVYDPEVLVIVQRFPSKGEIYTVSVYLKIDEQRINYCIHCEWHNYF